MEYKDLVGILSDDSKYDYIVSSLRESMASLGFSQELTGEFLDNLAHLNVEGFIQKHKDELARVQLGYFFGELVPKYFSDNVVAVIPAEGKVFDLGCGRGTLIQEIIKRGNNDEVVGIDIKEAPEWNEIKSDNVRMEVVQEEDFLSVLERERPDTVTATWVFHHMEYDQQKRYIEALYKSLKEGAVVVVLEDSYAETIPPESGKERAESFMKWSKEDRQKIMGVLDWIANRIFSMRTTMPVPFAYRTLEDWKGVFEEVGFTTLKARFIGFPDDRDINSPQSLIVLKK